jgi:AhpD family alkylhydroperoxidase
MPNGLEHVSESPHSPARGSARTARCPTCAGPHTLDALRNGANHLNVAALVGVKAQPQFSERRRGAEPSFGLSGPAIANKPGQFNCDSRFSARLPPASLSAWHKRTSRRGA